jgi:nucleoid-associated protein YgaU
MSLPSQSTRSMARGGAVTSRRKRRGPARAALPFVVLAALVAIVWFAMRPAGSGGASGPGGSTPADPSAADLSGTDVGDRVASNAGDRSAPVERPSKREPVRALPGTEELPPDEVDRALAESAPVEIGQGPRNTGGSGGVLDRALDSGRGGETAPTRTSPPPTTPGTTPATTPTQPSGGSDRVRLQLDTARRLVAENDRVGARALLSRVLRDPSLGAAEANLVRDELTEINDQLVFGRLVEPGDPIVEEYTVVSGDSLSRIATRRELAVHWKLIQRVNGLKDPTRIRLGQKLKLVRGPFHAVVDKSEFRMDIWHGPPTDPSRWVYIRSFDVGLGEGGGTPTGTFVVSANKLENPGWVNPRDSRERYEPNDPRNPIGEFWLGLDGTGQSEGVTGYGIHGTIEPQSIGRNMSMGCVRLRDEDIEVVYELLAERVSRVEIVP